jgi:hypothetical protein
MIKVFNVLLTLTHVTFLQTYKYFMILQDDSKAVLMIKELLETRMRPTVQDGSGDIEYIGLSLSCKHLNAPPIVKSFFNL